MYFTVQYSIEYSSTVSLFQAQDVWKQAYYLCEKYYKPIEVQYYIADCVCWVPRLTLLDLWTNWTYERALGMQQVHM